MKAPIVPVNEGTYRRARGGVDVGMKDYKLEIRISDDGTKSTILAWGI
jgi:hypothetical protein